MFDFSKTEYLKMAYMWLNDEDSVKDKLYEYYKHIPKED